MNERTATSLIKLLLALSAFFATGLFALGAYVYRSHASTRFLQAELVQKQELQRTFLKQLPSDQCLFPHFKNAVAFCFNPFIGQATLWGAPGHPYPVNLLGLRGPAVALPAPGRRRIVLVGDSFYFGWKLTEEEKLGSALQRLLKDLPYDVVTMAVPGWNVRSEAAFLKGTFNTLRPDVIVWEVCPNDTWDVGGVIPPASLSWDFSPQNREPETNAFNAMNTPLPVLPAILARQKENLGLIDAVRREYGVTVLAAPTEIPPALWGLLAQQAGVHLPVHFIPDKFKWDRRALISESDSHPTSWATEHFALGYAAKLVDMGVLPAFPMTPDQQEQLQEWKAVNAVAVGPADLDRDVRELGQTLPETFTTEADFRRVVAGYMWEGRLGRHGIVHLRVPAGRADVTFVVEPLPQVPRFQRQMQVAVRDFEARETVTSRDIPSSAGRVSLSFPLPTGTSRFPFYEVEWRFNYDDCDYPNRCFSARLVSISSR